MYLLTMHQTSVLYILLEIKMKNSNIVLRNCLRFVRILVTNFLWIEVRWIPYNTIETKFSLLRLNHTAK